MAGFLLKGYRRARAADGCAELLSLYSGPLREVSSGDTSREAQVVFDPRAGPRLPSHRDHLDDQRKQSLRRAVHCGGEPRRTGAHDGQIIEALRQFSDGQAEVIGQNTWCRVAQHRARDDHDWQHLRGDAELLQKALDFAVSVWIQPLVRDATTSQELANARGVG